MDLVDSQEGIKERVNKEKKEVFLSRGKINTALILKDVRAGGVNTFPNPAEQTSAGEKNNKKKVEKLPSCQTQVRVVSSLQRREGRRGKECLEHRYCNCCSVSAIMFLVVRVKAPVRFCLDMEGWSMSMNG